MHLIQLIKRYIMLLPPPTAPRHSIKGKEREKINEFYIQKKDFTVFPNIESLIYLQTALYTNCDLVPVCHFPVVEKKLRYTPCTTIVFPWSPEWQMADK